MYIIEKIRQLYQNSPDSVEGRISRELLRCFKNSDFPPVGDFCRRSGISRASLHRFVSEGGFSSWKDLIHSVEDDLRRNDIPLPVNAEKFSSTERKNGIRLLKKSLWEAESVLVYGDLCHIPYLEPLWKVLQKNGIPVRVLNQWDLKSSEKQILSNPKTVLILFDLNMRTDTFLEFSENRPYLINPSLFNHPGLAKFHIAAKKPADGCGFIPVLLDASNRLDECSLVFQISELAGSIQDL